MYTCTDEHVHIYIRKSSIIPLVCHGNQYIAQCGNCISHNQVWWSLVNSLWPSDTVWLHRSGSTLAQVMACCLMAPSHYLNQCWLMISEVLWHSPDSNFTENTWDIYCLNEFEISLFETVVKSPRGQWVKGQAALDNTWGICNTLRML